MSLSTIVRVETIPQNSLPHFSIDIDKFPTQVSTRTCIAKSYRSFRRVEPISETGEDVIEKNSSLRETRLLYRNTRLSGKFMILSHKAEMSLDMYRI